MTTIFATVEANVLLKHIEAETNGSQIPDDVFKCIFLNGNLWILIKISLKFVPNGPITLTPYMVLQLFATRFAAYAGGIRVSFIQPCLF